MLAASTPMSALHVAQGQDVAGFDVNVVSLEGVMYRTDRQKLAAASTVLRNQLLSNPGRVHINTPSATLGPFLDIVLGEADLFPVVNDRASILGALDILVLLKQYDCAAALTYALTALKCLAMEHDVCPLETFVLGAALDDVTLCRTAIVYGSDADIAALETGAVANFWPSVPAHYRNALARAWETKDPKDRGNRFVQEMCLEDGHTDLEPKSVTGLWRVAEPVADTKIAATRVEVRPVEAPQVPRFQVDEDPFYSDDEE